MKIRQALLLLVLLLVCPSGLKAQPAVRYTGTDASLGARWGWAQQQAGHQGGYWIGYSIYRMMGEDSFIGMWDTDKEQEATLEAVIYGKASPEEALPSEEAVRREAERVLFDLSTPGHIKKKERKEVALLFFFEQGAREPSGLQISNLTLYVDLKGHPLYWLGPKEDAESLAWLQGRYDRMKDPDLQEELLTAVGIHQDAARVVPFLTAVLTGRGNDEVREQAAFWLGQQQDAGVLGLLIETARKDRSPGVREQAVFAVSQIEIPEATDALIELARRGPDREVREKAVFWLGQKASRRAEEALRGFVDEEEDTGLQKQAVFALSQLPDERATPLLIDVAKTHRNPAVRKQAIFWLGQSEDPRALDLLIELVRGQ